MLGRCYDPGAIRYARYGGRGIFVCDRWHLFKHFLADMGGRPAGKTLGRIDNDGNYEPGNCSWQTPREQAANTRRSKRLVVGGVAIIQAEAARRAGVMDATILRRLGRGLAPDVLVRNDLVKKVKLRAVDANQIKAAIVAGNTDQVIAARFSVSRQMVNGIRRGNYWGAR